MGEVCESVFRCGERCGKCVRLGECKRGGGARKCGGSVLGCEGRCVREEDSGGWGKCGER